ncbi:MAG: type III pantothenate kinase, partial [Nitrospinota bacterium]|nr:type III pantothenate kinase [Nitrospinota bacterium]
GVALEALVERAARLPRIEPSAPSSVIGKNTVNSIQAGMFFGYKGLIKGIVGRMKLELGDITQVVATGGQSLLFSGDEEIFDHINPDLTLIGLRLVAERNP